MNIKFNKDIAENSLDNYSFKKMAKGLDWVHDFEAMSKSEKIKIFGYLEQEQAYFIKDSMKNMHRNIPLVRLGKFTAKHSRIKYYELRKQYPNKSIEEIKQMVIDDHIEQENKKKNNKKRSKEDISYLQFDK